MKRFFLIISAALVSLSAWAQKPALDHSVYDGWNSIVRPVDQMDKEWVIYGIRPQEGDGLIKFYNTRTGVQYYNCYDNHRISKVDMHKEDLDGKELVRYPLITNEQIFEHN